MALTASLFASPVQALETLPNIMITADRIGQNQASISADTTVISRKDIEQSQATTVVDILRSQVGMDVASSGGAGKTTSVFLRGGNSGQTLVLIDGVRVGSATTGSFDWANLSTADIEKIEIVRGPQSSLYGGDAMGGVIQIFTRKGTQGSKTHISGELGSYGTSSAAVSVLGKTASNISYALTANGLRTASVSAAVKGKENDPYRQFTLSGRLNLPVGKGELALIVRHVNGKTSLDGGFPLQDILNYTSNTKQSVASVKLTYPLSDSIENSLQLSRSIDDVIGYDPAGGFNNSDFRTQIDQLTWQNHIDWEALSLLTGVDMYRSQGYSNSARLNRAITQAAGFAALSGSVGMADVNASMRYDKNSATPNQVTYKLGVALHPLDGLKVSANYGTGFKAPSLNDLYFPASAFSAGNANLKPEKSKGWDIGLGYQYQHSNMKAGIHATWFHQNYQDLIVWQASPTFFYSPINIGKAHTQGLEISANMAYQASYLQANWTYLDAKDLTTGSWLARRAKESGSVTFGSTIAKLHAEVLWYIVGPRFSSAGNQKYMEAYKKIDMRMNYPINKQWKLTARVENAGNVRYEEVSGYGVLGRAWYGGISSDF
ncbi:MAG: TonB-dependent receptor [Zetaproteobacteria bacterium]|nr:TonB-dependent receptor [Zetaproteobacteria bacterium]